MASGAWINRVIAGSNIAFPYGSFIRINKNNQPFRIIPSVKWGDGGEDTEMWLFCHIFMISCAKTEPGATTTRAWADEKHLQCVCVRVHHFTQLNDCFGERSRDTCKLIVRRPSTGAYRCAAQGARQPA